MGDKCPNCEARAADNIILDINFAYNSNSEIITTISNYNNNKEEIYELVAKLLFLISVGGMAQRCYDAILAMPNLQDKQAVLSLYAKYIEHHHLTPSSDNEPLVSPLNVFKEEQV